MWYLKYEYKMVKKKKKNPTTHPQKFDLYKQIKYVLLRDLSNWFLGYVNCVLVIRHWNHSRADDTRHFERNNRNSRNI